MGRINLNQLEKIEGLPSKIGIGKSLLKPFGGTLKSAWDKTRHGEHWYRVRHQIMRNSVGKNWDEIVRLIKSKLPSGFVEEHSWIIDRPHLMVQNSVTGYWHWQDKDGELSTYGYETPKKLKNSGPPRRTNGYYLDVQNRLKWIKDKAKTYRSPKPNKSEQREVKTFANLVNFLSKKADYYKRIEKYRFTSWKQTGETYTYKPTITFKHPTETIPVVKYNAELKTWMPTEERTPLNVTLDLDQFKLWCNNNNKTYFLNIDGTYHTNLKWSFKQ